MKNNNEIILADLESANRDLFIKKKNTEKQDPLDTSRRILLIYLNQNDPTEDAKKKFLQEFISNRKLYDKKVSRFFGEEVLSATPKSIFGNHVFYHIKTIHFYKKVSSMTDLNSSYSKMKSKEIPKNAQEDIESLVSLSNCKLWMHLARVIAEEYDHYCGFVLFHPIQFIEYTASALSYCFSNLAKPVVFTGYFNSLRPVLEKTENLFDSLLVAGNYSIPEVCILDRGFLYRANRSRKKRFYEITSPNIKALGRMKFGTLMVDWERVLPMPPDTAQFGITAKFEENIGHLIYHPFITQVEIDLYFKNKDLKALVIECYGIGDLPDNNEYLLDSLKAAIERGLLIYAITQCDSGYVSNVYVNNFSSMGIESGHDFITPSIMTKLSWLIGNFPDDLDHVKRAMQDSPKGEMTKVHVPDPRKVQSEFNILTEMLFENITKKKKLQNAYFSECIAPAILKKLTISTNSRLLSFFFDSMIISKQKILDFRDHSDNNILHLFASEGTKDFWERLVQTVTHEELRQLSQMQNKQAMLPLMESILSKNFYTIKMLEPLLLDKEKEILVNESNRDRISEQILAEYLESGSHDLLKLAFFSGVKDFGFICTHSGTFLSHLAVLKNDVDLLVFLIKEQLIDFSAKDGRGMTIKTLAQALRKNEILTYLTENESYT